MKHATIIASVAALLTGCAVGPNYRPPVATPSTHGAFASGAESVFTATAPPEGWWRLFDSPALDALVARALAANTDLRVAAANLAQSRAVLQESRAGRFPSTILSASGAYQQTSAAGLGACFPTAAGGSPGAAFAPSQYYDAGLDVSYELDLFGRVSRSIEASKRDAQALEATLDDLRTTVAAETTRAFASACAYGEQIVVARRSLALQQQTLELTQRVLDAGTGTALEVAQARAQAETTRATIPTLEGQRRSALYQLAVLTGRSPSEIPAEADACSATPKVRTPLPVGDGAGLIRRRPDVRRAERQLAGATARIGVATASLYPTITLGGGVGTSATKLGDLTSDSAFRFSVGPGITWSFPNILVARARIRQSEFGADSALAAFDGVVLTALSEAEQALTTYARELDRNAALRIARDQGAEAVRLSQLRFTTGVENFLTVLDTQRTLATAEASLAQSDASLASDQVSVFKALGGGWENAPPVVQIKAQR